MVAKRPPLATSTRGCIGTVSFADQLIEIRLGMAEASPMLPSG
jgi:hypothetical protein